MNHVHQHESCERGGCSCGGQPGEDAPRVCVWHSAAAFLLPLLLAIAGAALTPAGAGLDVLAAFAGLAAGVLTARLCIGRFSREGRTA
ncbi:hypothetical protein [Kiritimatiella glycovorans]|uniref:Uncharacterized protein n=1 Tax=Kiritimatiella glycovorans TaxID=1307763 RepID=A0A0G3EDL6_9BACT|nr:hypothetical protein [Kiritimatiella glycovorans]AKJ64413.1 hypothetical protein L21SP4_01164 [Kiritimatiella glycovorans]